MFLQPQLPALFQKIRQAFIIEYWIPYEQVHLPKMAKDLGFTDVSKLEQRVEELLLSGCLKDCRIDSRSLTLSRPSANENSTVSSIAETHKQLHQLGQYLSDDGFAVMVHLE